VAAGPDSGATPRVVTRRLERLGPDADPRAAVKDALAELAERAQAPGVHTSAVEIDARRWELAHVTLWTGDAPAGAGTAYTVLHLSRGG